MELHVQNNKLAPQAKHFMDGTGTTAWSPDFHPQSTHHWRERLIDKREKEARKSERKNERNREKERE